MRAVIFAVVVCWRRWRHSGLGLTLLLWFQLGAGGGLGLVAVDVC